MEIPVVAVYGALLCTHSRQRHGGRWLWHGGVGQWPEKWKNLVEIVMMEKLGCIPGTNILCALSARQK